MALKREKDRLMHQLKQQVHSPHVATGFTCMHINNKSNLKHLGSYNVDWPAHETNGAWLCGHHLGQIMALRIKAGLTSQTCHRWRSSACF